MRAIVRRGGVTQLSEVAAPVASAGDVIIEIAVAGTCRTDLFVADGTLPVADGRVLGHECQGRIVASASDERRVGERVAVIPGIPCGHCPDCAARPERCARPRFLGVAEDGAFAQLVRVPARCALPLPDSIPDREGAFVEPLAAALAVLDAGARDGDSVAVVGRNRIGELVARVLESERGVRPTLLEEGEPVPRDAFDVVVETLPTSAGLDIALEALRPGGKLVLKSRPAARVPFDLALAVKKEIALQGARYASFSVAIAWLLERRVALEDLLGPVLPLTRFERAFELARAKGAPKVFLAPGASG
jgi:threonine dehydrogenase-like Zn-dependent dehydrogenase